MPRSAVVEGFSGIRLDERGDLSADSAPYVDTEGEGRGAMTEYARDAEAIFLAALDRTTPQGRVAYVEATCVGDPELLRRVRELLSCHEGSQGLLDGPPPGLGGTV